VARIPVAHLHGGEATEGLIDEAIRHAITKMSHLHFVAADAYRQRVVQLGEHPDRVFLVGGLGVDNIKRRQLLDRAALEASLNFKFDRKNLLVTFHPVTLENGTAEDQMAELLAALADLKDTQMIFTLSNADTDGRALVPHGLRSAFRSWADDTHPTERKAAEAALGHREANAVTAAYARSDVFHRRIGLMQAWADHCHQAPGQVVNMPVSKPARQARKRNS
jgi:hypothetical protein